MTITALDSTLAFYRCKVCGARWLLWPDTVHRGGWNLLDRYQRPGSCCDNVAMGEQLEHLRDIPLTTPAPRPKTTSWAVTVERNGDQVVTIASNCLSGRDLSVEDERVIRLVAEHLHAFVGKAEAAS